LSEGPTEKMGHEAFPKTVTKWRCRRDVLRQCSTV